MKKLKKCLLLILVVSIVTGFTNVKAYSGVVDSNDDIQMPDKLVNGQGQVTISRNFHDYTMSYQLVEIDNNTYKQIVKLKEELLVAEYYNIYEADQSDLNYDNYVSAYEYYKEKYGTTVDNYTDSHIDEVLSQIIGLWPNYTGNWITAEGKNINIDLSTIAGTHDYVIWTKVVTDTSTIYEADAYELVGTKIVDKEPDDDDNIPGDNTPDDDGDTPEDNTPDDDDNTPGDNTQDNDNNTPRDNTSDNEDKETNKKDTLDDKTVVPEKKLPQTGVVSNIVLFAGIALAMIIAIVSYRKMKSIK